ncbi:MAG: helix-turn-helix domain-containing protein [Planctomycetes bacterium]|nr:helix-turn-helix domain-containing protein [Planctomycetota bacterium]
MDAFRKSARHNCLGMNTMNYQSLDYDSHDRMTPKEVAQYWRLSESTIYAWIREERIPFKQPAGKGGAIRIPFHAFKPDYLFPNDDPRRGRTKRLPGKIPDWMNGY